MTLELIFKISCCIVFWYVVLAKWGAVEYYQAHKPKGFPICTWCFFFWVSFIVNAVIYGTRLWRWGTGLDLPTGAEVVVNCGCITVLSYYLYATIVKGL